MHIFAEYSRSIANRRTYCSEQVNNYDRTDLPMCKGAATKRRRRINNGDDRRSKEKLKANCETVKGDFQLTAISLLLKAVLAARTKFSRNAAQLRGTRNENGQWPSRVSLSFHLILSCGDFTLLIIFRFCLQSSSQVGDFCSFISALIQLSNSLDMLQSSYLQ